MRRRGLLGPIYGGLPEVGVVDFTEAGATRWLQRHPRSQSSRAFAYTDVIHEKSSHFLPSYAAAISRIKEIREWDGVINVADPVPIGPWRAQWWRRFSEGYRVDVEEKRQWQGHGGGGGEHCGHYRSAHDATRRLAILDRYEVSLAQWLIFDLMELGCSQNSPTGLCRNAMGRAIRLNESELSEEQYLNALTACLKKGWIMVLDQSKIDEVRQLLRDNPALLVLPRTAELRPQGCYYDVASLDPLQLTPEPKPDASLWGRFEFTSEGANLYRRISAEWLGADWEDELRVSVTYYWEEHRYSESDAGFEKIIQEHIANGNVVLNQRIVPLGPWCVYWWDRFPAGYRLELELGLSDYKSHVGE